MCHKVMIMEIKEKYALAMGEDGQILRIKIKEGMHIGDRIYILEEDLYQKEEEKHPVVPIIVPFETKHGTKKRKPRFFKQMTAVAAAAAVFLAIFTWSVKPSTAYAMVTVDGERNLEVTINKKHVVKDAVSKDGSLSEAETKKLIGQQIEAVEGYFEKERISEQTAVVGYAMCQDATKEEKEALHRKLEQIFGTEGVLYVNGSKKDMEEAKKAQKSLGIYLTEQAIHGDDFDKVLNKLSEKELWDLLKKQPLLMDEKKNRDTIEKELEEHETKEEREKEEQEKEEEGTAGEKIEQEEKDEQEEGEKKPQEVEEEVTTEEKEEIQKEEKQPEAPEEESEGSEAEETEEIEVED